MNASFAARSYDFVKYECARNWIGGQWLDAKSGNSLDVINPRHGKAMGSVVMSAAEDVDAAVQAAKKAAAAWKTVPIRDRAQVMYRLRQLMHRDLVELAWLVSHENGKTYDESMASVLKGIECIEYGCSLPNLAAGGILDVSSGVSCQSHYEPLGVVAGITPFNFPLMVPFWMLPQALVAGNSFVLKPSEQVPLSSIKLALLLKEAGLPDGVFNVVQGAQAVVEAISDHADIAAVGFVGSTRVARIVYARGAASGKRMLCLGGAKNHVIVVPDADPHLTAQNVAASFTGCAGQRCMAASVMVAVGDVEHIIKDIVKHASALVTGKDMGAIISQDACTRIKSYIDGAEHLGAKVLLDGRTVTGDGDGYWLGPTILDHVTRDMPAWKDEIFGPVLSIVHVDNIDEAIKLENSCAYGNGGAVYTSSGDIARKVALGIEAGMCGVNIGVPVPREPFAFGGFHQSKFGHGDITGWDGFRFWTRTRKVTTKWAVQKDQNWMS